MGHHFISYSTVDGQDFALRLSNALEAGPPHIPTWVDQRKLQGGPDWDRQIVEAIRDCDSLIFIMTRDSVEDESECKSEWVLALKYKKPIIPVRLHRDAELPFRLGSREYIDFSREFDQGLARLRHDLEELASPRGILQAMRYRMADANRDLRRAADDIERGRIQDEIDQLKKQIAEQQRAVEQPQAAAEQTERSIQAGLERERKPEKQIAGEARTKFINPPPVVAPTYFQDRHVETKLIGNFLKDEAQRLLMINGRAGIGKTAMACRLLKSLESGRLPDDLGPLSVDGIVYLSALGSRRVSVPNLYADLCQLLPTNKAQELDALYKNPQISTEAKMRALLNEFPSGRVVVLLDNFEDVVDSETSNIADAELNEALQTVLNAPHHAVKVILTTRIAPRELNLVQPGRQSNRHMDEGLESPFAENILREMDADGMMGLKTASDDLLNRARVHTRGYPRALEALYAILSADRYTTLEEVLSNPLPENVVEALVGQAFNRLDPTAQRVMEALAVYVRPVTPAAVDYLLQPYLPGINGAPVLNRLVNMHFVRREGSRYYQHAVDRAYALSRIPRGEVSDREERGDASWTQYALLHRGAEYFRQARQPRETWKKLDDLAPQLAEFELRYAGEDYDTAASVLREIDFDYLLLWGHFRLMIEMHERLQGKIDDATLKRASTGNLGTAYFSMGQAQKAIVCYEQALASAREQKDRQGEGVWLGNLGSAYADLGDARRAIEFYEQALAIDREIGDRRGEGADLGNLGNRYAELGQTARAIEYYEQALVIHREIGDRGGEGARLGNLADALIDGGQYTEAIQRVLASVKIGEEIGDPVIGSDHNRTLACAYLYAGDLPAARAAVETARRYDAPLCNHNALALLGVIALRQADGTAAREAFAAAVAQADNLLVHTAQYFNALDAKALALCGLALCGDKLRLPEAVEAHRAARAITKAPGIVGRVLRLFDALAVVDTDGILGEVRKVAAGG